MYCDGLYWMTSQPAMMTSIRDEGRQQDQRHRNAVDSEVIVDIERRDPRRLLDELHLRVATSNPVYSGMLTRNVRSRKDQRQPARHVWRLVPTRQHDCTAQDRAAKSSR